MLILTRHKNVHKEIKFKNPKEIRTEHVKEKEILSYPDKKTGKQLTKTIKKVI